ncbi:hypothetical protein [Arthrobacter sp. JSM 101049]|uniref:hypothetical protein n=1 Tax=Arthrobacter sp. JSM 101049 TaxID=929097 RepID=UPI003566FE0B
MSSTMPERDPNMEPDPGAEFVPDPEDATGDPLDPVPMDGRDSQPAEGSSDNAAMMEEGDPLREPGYAEAEELPYVEDEVNELEDSGELADPAADQLANESLDAEQDPEVDAELAADAGNDFRPLADPAAEDPGTDEDLDDELDEELGEDPDSASS